MGYEETGRVRHIVLFVALSLFFMLYFALRTFNTQLQFNRFIVYEGLVAISLGGMLFLLHYFGEPQEEGSVPDWDEDFKAKYFGYIFIGIGAIILISMIVMMWGRVFYVVSWNEISMLGQLSVIPSSDYVYRVFQEAVWQTFVVSYSEEILKLVVILTFIRALKDYPPLDIILGAGIPIALWAEFHTMLAYGRSTSMVLAAFLAGVVLFILLVKTGSILVPILVHAAYNLIVVLPTIGVKVELLPIVGSSVGQLIQLASVAVQNMLVFLL